MSFVAGAYRATYNGLALGKVEDGFTMSYRRFSETITTDVTGDAMQDGVYRGVQLNISFILSEWDAVGAQAAFWPFDSNFGELGALGRLDTTLAKPLVLSSCGTHEPDTITFHRALLSPDFDVTTIFANRHRKIALQMTVYPLLATNVSSGFGQCEELRLFTAVSA